MMILVLGATGFLGRHVCRKLTERKSTYVETSLSLGVDLLSWDAVKKLFEKHKPSVVLNCAAYVGGIGYGYKYPATIYHKNMLMQINILRACTEFNVQRLINPISNCAYPGEATLFREEEFWDGPIHESVLAYGLSRKAFVVGSWAFHKQHGLDTINLVMSNMYGPGDHWDEERSHAMGALIMKFARAKRENEPSVTVWGTGKPVREWLYVGDGAEALIRAIDIPPQEGIINIGVGKGISIKELAERIKNEMAYEGTITYDTSKPDGAPYKTVDGSLGHEIFSWKPEKPLEIGIKETVESYLKGAA